MTIPELNKKFDNVVRDIKSNSNGEIMAKIGIEATRMIKTRVTETGVNAEGQKFKPYSTKDILIGAKSFKSEKYAKQVLGSKAKRKELEWRTMGGSSGYAAYLSVSSGSSGSVNLGKGVRLAILKGGYAELRRLQNLQINHVDFIVTGRMWSNINVISKAGNHQAGEVIIGAQGEDNKKKLSGNTERKGDILDLSESEITQLKKSYKLDVLQIFRNNGLT